MLYIPKLETARFNVQLQELTLKQNIELISRPAQLFEQNLTAFLKMAILDFKDLSTSKNLNNPQNWTACERILVLGHYLMTINKNNGEQANFSVGDGFFSDYLDLKLTTNIEPLKIGQISGDTWYLRHLTGQMLEVIEQN